MSLDERRIDPTLDELALLLLRAMRAALTCVAGQVVHSELTT